MRAECEIIINQNIKQINISLSEDADLTFQQNTGSAEKNIITKSMSDFLRFFFFSFEKDMNLLIPIVVLRLSIMTKKSHYLNTIMIDTEWNSWFNNLVSYSCLTNFLWSYSTIALKRCYLC